VEEVFIVLTNTDFWDDPPRARHQLSEALAKRHKVLFVSANVAGPPRLQKASIHERLQVIRPSFPVDYRLRYRIRCINVRYQSWLFGRLRQEVGKQKVTVINFDNTATELFRYFENVVFYCNDYNIRYYYLPFIKRYFEECEQMIAARSVLCVGTARFLVERLRRFNPNAYELRLGAPSSQNEPIFGHIETVRLALVGFLAARRLSMTVIEALLGDPHVELHVFGRIESSLARELGRRSNVRLRGVVRGEQLLEELRRLDVGIAPYRVSDVNPGGTPNKLWLYLAAGKPVVIADLETIRDWAFPPGCVYRAGSANEFVDKVQQAYREDNSELSRLRADFARRNSWDERVNVLLERISVCVQQEKRADSAAGS
jgi:glycosyltransferase involved in cell wall biosynthesis